jgi:type II secretory pathway component GspD/PulD (secretin)
MENREFMPMIRLQIKGWIVGLVAMLCMALLCGCAARQPQTLPQNGPNELAQLKPQQLLNQAKQRPRPGPPPFSERLAPLTKEVLVAPALYSLTFDKAPLGQVVAALTKDAAYNLSVESDIDLERPVMVNLRNVTLEEALDTIVVNGAGYAWSLEKGTLSIKRFTERIYQFDFLDMIGETSVDVGGDMLGSGVQNSGVTGKYQITAQKPQQSSDLWIAVEQALGGLKSEEGILRLNRNAGVIYMADTPRRVAAMVRFLDSLGEALNRQVLVEARILEVRLSDESKYGIDWSQLGVVFSSSSGALPDIFDLGFNQGGFIAKGSPTRFSALFDFLRTQGDVRVLSNPHLTVMNRQSAVLTIGYQFPYADIDGVDRDLETGVITIGTSIRRAVLGLQLGLTTQISADGMITFHIVPTLTRIQREVNVEIPTGVSIQSISNPVIDLQELATTVRVRDGNSFVLAGLISKIRTLKHEGLPFFSDLPWVGALFKHIEEIEENSELVIFVTPYISTEPF